jgi:hypothetical protein
MKKIAYSFLGILCLNSVATAPAHAYDWFVDAKVRTVEPTYIPRTVSFAIDRAGGSCPAGGWLTWNGQGSTDTDKKDNVKAVFSVLLLALNGNKTVRVYGKNAGCQAVYIHLLNY